MTIRFKCPHCQKTLGVKDHLAGKRAACPACKEVLRIPTNTPTPTAPPINVEEEAAAALNDPPAETAVEKDDGTKPIIFTCDFCDEEVQMPYQMAGKQAPCPNPECRRIIKIPIPKIEGPRDWRERRSQGPSAALANQPEKLEGVIGGQDDRKRVSNTSLREAGVLDDAPPRPSIGVRGWIIRSVWLIAALGVGSIIFVALNQERNKTIVADDFKEWFSKGNIEALGKISPHLVPEMHYGAGTLLLYKKVGEISKIQNEFIAARGLITQIPANKRTPPQEDLFLIDLALAQIEMGGSDDEALQKEKMKWSDLQKELKNTLFAIQAPEARLWGMRRVASRLLAKKQNLTAIGLSHLLANEGNHPLMKSQQIALFLQSPEGTEKAKEIRKPPEDGKEIEDVVQRVGYAESYAHKGNFDEAAKIAGAKGKRAHDQLEAWIGVATIALESKKGPEGAKSALPAIQAALAAAKADPKSVTAWDRLQLIHLGSRTDAHAEVQPLIEQSFKDWAKLEWAKGRGSIVVDDLADKDRALRGLAYFSAARLSQGTTLEQTVRESDADKVYLSLVSLGRALGEYERRP